MRKRKSKLTVILVILAVAVSALLTFGENLNLPFALPAWDDLFGGAGLTDTLKDDGTLLSVYFIDVGQGDCTLLKSPGGCVLIDAGEREYGKTVVDTLKALSVTRLDYIIATHPHSDHIGGLPDVLNAFTVDNVIMPKLTERNMQTTAAYERFLNAVKRSGAKSTAAQPGAQYELGELVVTLLSPASQSDNLNNMSVVTSVTYGKTSLLFTGDAESAVEKELLAGPYSRYLRADVFHAGHHGSRTSNTADFLGQVAPSLVVISCGRDNSYKHPHSEAMKRFEGVGAEIRRTDMHGTVVIQSDGKEIHM